MPHLKEFNRSSVSRMRFLIDNLIRISRVKIITRGIEQVPNRSTIFVCNHFTRMETILLPYVVLTRRGIMARSLTAQYVFDAFPKDFMAGVGSVPLKLANRDDLAVKSLLSGECWIIFPEGRMVKDKDVKKGDTFRIHDGDVHVDRPPHTGAAVLALRARSALELFEEFAHKHKLENIFDLDRLEDLRVTLVPVNITYYPLRVDETGLSRQVERLVNYLESVNLSDQLIEELKVESSIFSPGVEIHVNFGEAIDVKDYTKKISPSSVFPPVGKKPGAPSKAVKDAINRLMFHYMERIYRLTTVTTDHLAARLLFGMARRGVLTESVADIRRRVFLAAMEVRKLPDLCIHDVIAESPESLVKWGGSALEGFFGMGVDEALMEIQDDDLVIKERDFKWPHEFHDIRVLNTIQVINNEITPLAEVTGIVDKTLTKKGRKLREETARGLALTEEQRYQQDYTRFFSKDESKEQRFGWPKLTVGSRKTGVLLIHGYMASPEEMSPLHESLVLDGYTVYSVRLAGHGTSPYDLETRSWEEWYRSVRVGVSVITNLTDRFFVCGFSMGGLLAWHLAAQGHPKLSGIVSISAAMRLVNRSSMLAPAIDFIGGVMKFFGAKKGPVQFVKNNPENPHINYFRNPIHGIDQLLELADVVRGELSRVEIPALILQGGGDPTVDPESATEYYSAVNSDVKGLVWIDSPYHGIVYRGGDEVIEQVSRFISEPESAREDSHRWIRG